MTTTYDKLKKAEVSPAWDRASAYVIFKRDKPGIVGKVLLKFPKDGMGPLEVFLWDWSDPSVAPDVQYGRASGCGYDKLAAALVGLTFAGIHFTDDKDWKNELDEAGYLVQWVI